MEKQTGDRSLVPPAVDTLPINIAILDSAGTILWTNKAWREFGAANDIVIRPDTVGVNYLEVTQADDDETAQQVATGLADVLAGNRVEFEHEYPCHSPDEKRWFLMRVASFTAGGDRYAAVAHIDITDRIQREHESSKFEKVIETAGQVVLITDRDGTITYVNPAFEKVTGYTPPEALGKTPRLLKSGEHDEEFYAELWETILAGQTWEGTIINRRKSGGLYYAHQTIAPVTTDDGDIDQFVALQTEITDLAEMQRQLQAHDDILRHDLRTELSVVRAHADQIAAETAAEADHATAIVKATERLLSTAEKTRDLRKFLELTMEPTPIDVVLVVEEVVDTQRKRFPEATIDSETPAQAVGLGVAELNRALTELIENGIVHSDQSPPWVGLTVTVVSDGVDITVADTGPGIPPMEYETFDHGKVPTQLDHRSGVGLDMAYWIVRRSGGRLHVTDRDPRGSNVTIHLPSAEEHST